MPLEATQTSKLTPFTPRALDTATNRSAGTSPATGDDAGGAEAMKQMAYVKRAAPLVLAMIRRPGLDDSEDGEKIIAMRSMLQAMENHSSQLTQILGTQVANKEWLQSMIESQIAEWVAVKWVVTGSAVLDQELDALLRTFPAIDDLQSIIEAEGSIPQVDDGAMRLASLQMTTLRTCEPILSELSFVLDASEVEKVFLQLQDALLDRVGQTAFPVGLDASARLALMQTTMSAAAKLMATAISVEAGRGPIEANSVIARWTHSMDVVNRVVSGQQMKVLQAKATVSKPAVKGVEP